MFKIGDRVYFTKDCIIQDGFVVGIATYTIKDKVPLQSYLVGKTNDIKTDVAMYACFSGEHLSDYLLFPDTALFESIEALQKRQKELYLWSKGVKAHSFI